MTKYEILIEKMNFCGAKADSASGFDEKLHKFYQNAAEGFRMKIGNLTLETASKICCVA